MYVRPEVDETTSEKTGTEPLRFGVSGMLWRDGLVMFDRATETLWSQVSGEAISGPLKGRSLEQIASEVTTWKAWKERHPDTLALVKSPDETMIDIRRRQSSYAGYHEDPEKIGVRGTTNPDQRLPGKSLVYGIRLGDGAAAIPFDLLDRHPVLNAEVLGRPIVVFSPPGENAAMVYERTVDGEVLELERVARPGERLVARDEGTDSTWSWESGECLLGAFEGRRMTRISGTPVYWGVWAQFHPDTEIVGVGKAGSP